MVHNMRSFALILYFYFGITMLKNSVESSLKCTVSHTNHFFKTKTTSAFVEKESYRHVFQVWRIIETHYENVKAPSTSITKVTSKMQLKNRQHQSLTYSKVWIWLSKDLFHRKELALTQDITLVAGRNLNCPAVCGRIQLAFGKQCFRFPQL